MSIPLFEVNPGLDRKALAAQFARDRRIQIRDVLTELDVIVHGEVD